MCKNIRLYFLANKARKLIHMLWDFDEQYDCGSALTEYITDRRLEIEKARNKVWDKICKIDPTAPKRSRDDE